MSVKLLQEHRVYIILGLFMNFWGIVQGSSKDDVVVLSVTGGFAFFVTCVIFYHCYLKQQQQNELRYSVEIVETTQVKAR